MYAFQFFVHCLLCGAMAADLCFSVFADCLLSGALADDSCFSVSHICLLSGAMADDMCSSFFLHCLLYGAMAVPTPPFNKMAMNSPRPNIACVRSTRQDTRISKQARIAATMGEIGPSVMLGAATTLVGIVPLSFASNAIFRVFFKMFLIIIAFGVSTVGMYCGNVAWRNQFDTRIVF